MFEILGARTGAEKSKLMSTISFEKIGCILSAALAYHIVEWLNEGRRVGEKAGLVCTLLYRASRDGWNASDFHAKCDNKGATLTVIKCTDGYVLGGYANSGWNSSGSWQTATGSFLFSLHGPSGVGPVKLHLIDPNHQHAMYGNSSHGPTFGGGHDLRVGGASVCDEEEEADFSDDEEASGGSCGSCRSNLGHTYHLPEGQSPETFFTGRQNFQAAEVEVFAVKWE
jgi:hypothetical protein